MRRRGSGCDRRLRTMRGDGLMDDAKTLLNVTASYFAPGEFEGERHGISMDPKHSGQKMQYLGPGTHVSERLARGDQGLNDLDKVAKKHDMAYMSALRELKQTGDKNAFKTNIWSSDDEFISKAQQSKDDPAMGKISSKLMSAKKHLEQANVLPTKVFSGGASDMDPAARLRERLREDEERDYGDMEGGWIGPLVSILASVGAPIISYLWDKLMHKGSGYGGSIDLSIDKKRALLINRLEDETRHMK